jgi:hypothetical protein
VETRYLEQPFASLTAIHPEATVGFSAPFKVTYITILGIFGVLKRLTIILYFTLFQVERVALQAGVTRDVFLDQT